MLSIYRHLVILNCVSLLILLYCLGNGFERRVHRMSGPQSLVRSFGFARCACPLVGQDGAETLLPVVVVPPGHDKIKVSQGEVLVERKLRNLIAFVAPV